VVISDADKSTGRIRALRRTLEQRLPSSLDSSIDGGAPWVSGVFGAVQAFLFSLAAVVIPSIAMTVAANAQVEGTSSSWASAIPLATRVWLLGHGVPLDAASASLTIVPLGVSVVAFFAAFVSARRTVTPVPSAWVAAVVTYAALTFLLVLVTSSTARSQMVFGIVGSVVIASLGFGWGMLSRPDAEGLGARFSEIVARSPMLLRYGLRGAFAAAAGVVFVAALVVLVWLVLGRSTVGGVVSDLGLDATSGVSLAIAQLTVLPNLVVWAIAWVAGPGFAVGSGTHFGPDEVTSAPLPALPILGALPNPGSGGGALMWVPLLVVCAGALGGWCVHRRLERTSWWRLVVIAGLIGLFAGLIVAALVTLGSGVAGPGRLADVGTSGLFIGLCVAAEIGAGALLLMIAVRREIHETVAASCRRLYAIVRHRPTGAAPAAAEDATARERRRESGVDSARESESGVDAKVAVAGSEQADANTRSTSNCAPSAINWASSVQADDKRGPRY
jgi:Family of unknown function (DUF6350)